MNLSPIKVSIFILALVTLVTVPFLVPQSQPRPSEASILAVLWTPAPPIRTVTGLPPIVADIESHLPAGHPYKERDLIGYVHESTHGINSLLRNLHGCPAFYVLKNRCVLMKEPVTTLSYSVVANMVPRSLHGDVYHLYLKQTQVYWNEQPSYVFDEFTAYANGADARKQLKLETHGETQYAVEFIVYSSTVALASKSTDPQMRRFLMWQIERVIALSGPSKYLDKLKTEPDATDLRVFMRKYYGPHWTKQTLGF